MSQTEASSCSATAAGDGSGGHELAINGTVWSTIDYSLGTSLFTGVPSITNMRISARNLPGTFNSSYVYTNALGGTSSVIGMFVIGRKKIRG